MGYFLAYQILPLLLVGLIVLALSQSTWFNRFGWVLIFIAGTLLQLALAWRSTPSLLEPDSMGFYLLSQGEQHDLRSILFRPKLYPLFLGLFPSLQAAVVAQCLLKSVCGLFLIRLGKIFAWRPAISHFLLLLFFLNSFWQQEPLRIMDTTLFTCLFTACFWIAVETMMKPSLWKFTALCFAAALTTLTRQVGDVSLLIAITTAAFAVIKIGKKSGVTLLLPLGLGLVLAMAGAMENYVRYGVFKRSVAMGNAGYTHVSQYALADAKSPEWDFVESLLPNARAETGHWKTNYRESVSWLVNALPHNVERALGNASKTEILASDKTLLIRATRWVRENPHRYLRSIQNEAARVLLKCEEYYPESLLKKLTHIPIFVVRVERGILHQPLWLWFGLGFLSLALGSGHRLVLAMLLLGTGSYILLIASIHIGFTRYGLPLYPCLLALAGPALHRLSSLLSPTR